MDIKVNPDTVPSWQIFDGVSARIVVNGQHMTALKSNWEPGTGSSPHRHHNEQIFYCLEGEMVFFVRGEEYRIKSGEILYIPPDTPHHQINKSDKTTVLFECFSPIREDLLNKKFDPK